MWLRSVLFVSLFGFILMKNTGTTEKVDSDFVGIKGCPAGTVVKDCKPYGNDLEFSLRSSLIARTLDEIQLTIYSGDDDEPTEKTTTKSDIVTEKLTRKSNIVTEKTTIKADSVTEKTTKSGNIVTKKSNKNVNIVTEKPAKNNVQSNSKKNDKITFRYK